MRLPPGVNALTASQQNGIVFKDLSPTPSWDAIPTFENIVSGKFFLWV